MFALNCKIIIRVIYTYMYIYLVIYVFGILVMMGWGFRENFVVIVIIFYYLICFFILNIILYRIKNVLYYIYLVFFLDFDSVCYEK